MVPLKLGSGPAVSVLAMLPVPWTVRKVPGSSVASGVPMRVGVGKATEGVERGTVTRPSMVSLITRSPLFWMRTPAGLARARAGVSVRTN